MTAAELIAKLQELPQDMKVFIPDQDGCPYSEIKLRIVPIYSGDYDEARRCFVEDSYQERDSVLLEV